MKDTTFFGIFFTLFNKTRLGKKARAETANNWRLSESSRSITSLHFSCGCQFLRLWKVHWNQTEPYLARGHQEEHKMAPCKYSAQWTLANVGHFFYKSSNFCEEVICVSSISFRWSEVGAASGSLLIGHFDRFEFIEGRWKKRRLHAFQRRSFEAAEMFVCSDKVANFILSC